MDSDDSERSPSRRTHGRTEPSPRLPRGVSNRSSLVNQEYSASRNVPSRRSFPSLLEQRSMPFHNSVSQSSRAVQNAPFQSPAGSASPHLNNKEVDRNTDERRMGRAQVVVLSPSTPVRHSTHRTSGTASQKSPVATPSPQSREKKAPPNVARNNDDCRRGGTHALNTTPSTPSRLRSQRQSETTSLRSTYEHNENSYSSEDDEDHQVSKLQVLGVSQVTASRLHRARRRERRLQKAAEDLSSMSLEESLENRGLSDPGEVELGQLDVQIVELERIAVEEIIAETVSDAPENEQMQGRSEVEGDILPTIRQPGTNSHSSPRTSIHSSSPIVLRRQERRARVTSEQDGTQAGTQAVASPQKNLSAHTPTQKRPYSVPQFRDALRRFKNDMEDHHRVTVRWLLHDARESHKRPLPMDKVSPFAQINSLQISKNNTPSGASIFHVESHTDPTKKTSPKLRNMFQTKSIHNDVKAVPKYSHYTAVKRNILSPDSQGQKVPNEGTDETSGERIESDEKSRKKRGTNEKSRKKKDSGLDNDSPALSQERRIFEAPRMQGHLDEWLQSLGLPCDRKSLMCYFLHTVKDSFGLTETDRQLLLERKVFGNPLDPNVTEIARMFSEAFYKVFDFHLNHVLFPKKYLTDLAKSEKFKHDEATDSIRDFYGTYVMTCLICGTVGCPTHGEYRNNLEDSEGVNPEEPDQTLDQLSMSYEAAFRKYRERHGRETTKLVGTDHPNCSLSCYRLKSAAEPKEWTPQEIDEVRRLWITLRDPTERACNIAFMLGVECWQVHNLIENFEKEPGPALVPLKVHTIRSKRPVWYDNKRKALIGNWEDATNAYLQHERGQADPCSHEGPCNKDNKCPCFGAKVLCESMCACPDDCLRRFTGCSCISSEKNCTSSNCICQRMNRECGPQCVSCGAIPRINPAARYDDDLFRIGCQNVSLQRGVSKKTILGESQLDGVGFGLYIAEDTKAGEYIGEYAGELISLAETEHRGDLHGTSGASFLFDLNNELVVDGAQLGNAMRFVNHADKDDYGFNCFARIMLVNGEHRIKFVAARNIEAGEELMFDYGKKFARVQGLDEKLAKPDGWKKGKDAVVSDEALKAAADLDASRNAGRRKMTAIRGGRRNTAIKSASGNGLGIMARKSTVESVSGSGSTAHKTAIISGGRTARKSAPHLRERERRDVQYRDEERELLDAIAPLEHIPEADDDSEEYVAREEDEDEEDGEEESEEDVDDDEAPAPRAKRHITRPSRYLR